MWARGKVWFEGARGGSGTFEILVFCRSLAPHYTTFLAGSARFFTRLLMTSVGLYAQARAQWCLHQALHNPSPFDLS
jgi:hypothetical protein